MNTYGYSAKVTVWVDGKPYSKSGQAKDSFLEVAEKDVRESMGFQHFVAEESPHQVICGLCLCRSFAVKFVNGKTELTCPVCGFTATH